ncbi:hypothetical protein PHMEG_00015739 [Phytophthora megakarya]|uniref:K-box domain-containing protein n=1 Tax=Phytophthora megakarya TaxID=4795 RepID=A0A225W1K1_9STRA|nr:hypothetical protein PHMEG_00015739 [Phytophthora megakarya]
MGFGVYATCIFLSTIALQALTSPSPAPSFLSRLSVDSLLWSQDTSDMADVDLRLRNLSVHRVRYVEEDEDPVADAKATLSDTLTGLLTPRRAVEVSSVVITWEDHPLAAHARKDALEDAAGTTLDSFSYDVQIWVTGWGLDGLWNPANRRVATWDPFVVLVDLPLEQEMAFRVRMKAKETKKSLLGFLLPKGLFSTETDGPWSEPVILSPTRDDELEAIITSLAGNKPLLLLLAVCIGSGCLVVAQLYFRRRSARSRQRQLLQMQPNRRSSSEKGDANEVSDAATDTNSVDSGKSVQELEHEIRDLRQELADSEEEVRQLMLFSGYGIETLAPRELEQLEREMKHTLKRIHHFKKDGATRKSEMRSNSKSQSVDEHIRRERRHHKRDALPLSPIFEHRSF